MGTGEVGLYTIDHLFGNQWIREITFNTEFKAFINASTKCMATGRVHRVIDVDRAVICVITLDDCKRRFQAR